MIDTSRRSRTDQFNELILNHITNRENSCFAILTRTQHDNDSNTILSYEIAWANSMFGKVFEVRSDGTFQSLKLKMFKECMTLEPNAKWTSLIEIVDNLWRSKTKKGSLFEIKSKIKISEEPLGSEWSRIADSSFLNQVIITNIFNIRLSKGQSVNGTAFAVL
jgi:hypothetical protein